ncbi:MAG TPA: adenylate/guanylate cyclase domain-containing protein, partial [Burkholderiaceae bacterium]|nr:adenylate/guanylate cyclase domain-containing protein [Burkholderiaceae bacterium]
QALKQVSILFLDAVGSTTLSQKLDPEETSAVMDGALARASEVVQAHQGKVLQYAGDNLLAVFGAGDAREDDAERAVRCGLALLELGRALGSEVHAAHGHVGFNVRVGIHTGGVLLGGGVDAEGTIRGSAVNVAARMEQTAPAGALRISHDTYALVRGMFDVQPQPPLQVKGLDEPVQSHLVQRGKPRSFHIGTRGIEGVATRMVGRDAERGLLQHAFQRLFVEKQLTAVTVVGEAGIGKSRLLYEFEAWSEARPETFYIFRGRATLQTQSQPLGLLRDILAWRFQIADDDTLEVAKAKFEQGIVPLFEHDDGTDLAEGHAHLLGHLLGIDYSASRHLRGILDDARQIRTRALYAAAQVFRRVAARSGCPVVLELEDLHWADDGTLDFLSQLCEQNRDVPMLVLALTRPALFERRPDWGGGMHQRIDLKPLDPGASRQLAGELLKSLAQVPAALSDLVCERAEGNPFYMEELVKMLVEQGAIAATGAQWTLRPEKLLATKVPASLTGVLQAGLDGLPAPERLALEDASVIGQVFWDQALGALDAQAPVALPALVRRGLTPPRLNATMDGMREYAFSHHILQEVTYATLLRRAKRALHARAAAWLAGLTGARASDFLGATAEHFELAGDNAQACNFFARAAEHAKARYAHDVALRHVSRAIALLDRSTDSEGPEALALRWRLLFVREHALNLQGHRAEQRVALDGLQRVADALDDDRLRSYVARRQSALAMRTVDHRAQEAAARQAMALAQRAGDVESRLQAQRLLADALGALGDLAAGEALARDGLAEARRRGLRRVEGVFLNALSYMAALKDDQVTGLSLDLQDLPIWRELGDPQGEAIALGNVGGDWLWFGELTRARQCLESALKLSRTVGARSLECGPLTDLSQVLLRQGDAAQALTVARAAVEIAVNVQARDYEAASLYRVGEAELALRHFEAAAAAFERAEAVAAAIGQSIEHDAVAGRARVALAGSDIAGAMAFVERVLASPAVTGALDGFDAKLILLTCHQVLKSAGDPRAPALLDRAHALLQSRAATINDPALRESFLTRISEHREILAAWQNQRERSADARGASTSLTPSPPPPSAPPR